MSHHYDSTPTQYNGRVGPPELTANAPTMPPDAFRVDAHAGTVQAIGAVSSASAPTSAPTDLLHAARVAEGRLGSHLGEKDRITFNGTETTVGALLTAGLISKGADGYMLSPEAMGNAAPQHEATPQYEGEAFPDGLEEIAEALHSSTDVTTQVALIGELVSKGSVSTQTLDAIAATSGATREQVAYAVSQVQAGFEQQASERLSRFGDPALIHQFAKEHLPAELKDAMTKHATMRSPAVYDKIGTAYIAALDSTPQGRSTILSGSLGGWHAHESSGKVIVSHPTKTKGAQITWSDAVKRGLMAPKMGGK